MKLIGDRVAIKVDEKPAETKTQGGIVLPGEQPRKIYTGQITHVGDDPDCQRMELTGKRVIFNESLNIERNYYEVAGQKLLVLDRDDVMAVLD